MNLKHSLPALCVLGFSIAVSPSLSSAADAGKPIRALLVTGGCCHDYTHQKTILTEGISARANVKWTIVHEGDGGTAHRVGIYEKPDWSKGFDVVVHDECNADVKDKDFVENILKPHREGLPAVNLHCTMHCYRVSFDNYKGWFEFTGIDTRQHGAQLPIAITLPNRLMRLRRASRIGPRSRRSCTKRFKSGTL